MKRYHKAAKSFFAIAATSLVMDVVLVNQANASGELDQKQATIISLKERGGITIGGNSQQILAQVIKAGISGKLAQIGVAVVCSSGISSNALVVETRGVREDNSKRIVPDAHVLATETIPADKLPPFADPLKPNFRIINFSAPALVREGERFSIVLRSDGQCVSANGPVGNPYPGGDGLFDSRPNPPGVWAPLAVGTERHDLPFQTFVSPGADHLKCYDAVSAKQKPREVMLEDRYGAGKALLGDVVRLCVPVDKNDEGVENPGQVLTCYQVIRDRSNPEKRRVKVRNQFGAISVTTKPSSILCVPSTAAGLSR